MDANHQCLIEILDQNADDCPEEIVEDPITTTEISLQAFSGAFNPQTIRLTRWVQSKPLSVLIDSGSTQNFIQELVVTRLGFAVKSLPAFKVFIGSGEYLVCKEVCRQVALSIHLRGEP